MHDDECIVVILAVVDSGASSFSLAFVDWSIVGKVPPRLKLFNTTEKLQSRSQFKSQTGNDISSVHQKKRPAINFLQIIM